MRYLKANGLEVPQHVKILIADDKAHMRRVIRGLLESHAGWYVAEAEDGVQAVDRAKRDRPDVVVLDLAMPALNGLEAARQIASALPGVPILLNTLYASSQIEREAERIGVQRVVSKLEEYQLVPAIEEALATGTAH